MPRRTTSRPSTDRRRRLHALPPAAHIAMAHALAIARQPGPPRFIPARPQALHSGNHPAGASRGRQLHPRRSHAARRHAHRHAEHGSGGNNSTFACRVLSSSATDAYSAYASAIGSLRARATWSQLQKWCTCTRDIRNHVKNWDNDDEMRGLSRGRSCAARDMTLRPHLRHGARRLHPLGPARQDTPPLREAIADEGLGDEFRLMSVERLAPKVMRDVHAAPQAICAQHRYHTGFIYSMSNIRRRFSRLCSPSPAPWPGRPTAWKSSSVRAPHHPPGIQHPSTTDGVRAP